MSLSSIRIPTAALVSLALLTCAGGASAQTESSTAEAQRLFEEGVLLLERGDFANACVRFDESHRMSPAGGTALDLGYCNERLGRLASALAAYQDARDRAQKSGRSDRALVAEEKMTDLARRVPRLQVRLHPRVAALAGVAVVVDGKAVADPSAALPVDPGMHLVEVSAKGMRSVSHTTEVVREGALVEVVIDSLVALSIEAPAPRALDSHRGDDRKAQSPPSSRKTLTYGLGAGGIVLTGVGAVAGVLAYYSHEESNELCRGANKTLCSDHNGVTAEKRAWTESTVATIGIAGGLVLVGAALYLVFTAPAAPPKAAWEPLTVRF